MTDPRYPIGKFAATPDPEPGLRAKLIDDIAGTPAALTAAIQNLTQEQLDTPYRDGGWTVRQVIHHVADSHINSYVRFRLALTEDTPVITTYEESLWAGLPDAHTLPPEVSLALLVPLHQRWVTLLRALPDSDFTRAFRHPELGAVSLEKAVQLYAWHGKHHTAHITSLRDRMGWIS